MENKKLLIAVCSLFVALVGQAQSSMVCTHIEGEVADTAVRFIEISRADQKNSYIHGDTIPFTDGRFSYDIRTVEPVVYWICAFNKDWIGRAVNFFADGATMHIKFIPNDSPEWYSDSPLKMLVKNPFPLKVSIEEFTFKSPDSVRFL